MESTNKRVAQVSDNALLGKAVTLTVDDWKNVLKAMEVGIQNIGFPAFEIGGRVMREISEQLDGTQSDCRSQVE